MITNEVFVVSSNLLLFPIYKLVDFQFLLIIFLFLIIFNPSRANPILNPNRPITLILLIQVVMFMQRIEHTVCEWIKVRESTAVVTVPIGIVLTVHVEAVSWQSGIDVCLVPILIGFEDRTLLLLIFSYCPW